MKKYLFVALLFCVSMGGYYPSSALAFYKSTKFTVLVVNENEEPLSGIRVGVGFEKNTGWGTDSSGQQGMTDSEGKLTFSGQSNGHITYGGRNDEYYPSYYDYDFKGLGTFGWEPWNPELKIVMRKIENPVPMYARNVKSSKKKIELPVLGREVGFDLEHYDWVAPYGKGETADFIFKATKMVKDKRDFDVEVILSFLNQGDGIITIKEDFSNGSEFKLPRFAPESGYDSQKIFEEHRRLGQKVERNFEPEDSYIFKVRSKYLDGELIEAKYGKIHGPIFIDANWTETARIYLKYYFNPDGTRNLEFDPKRNLFGNLPNLERVTEP
jgi:hypothetical protein